VVGASGEIGNETHVIFTELPISRNLQLDENGTAVAVDKWCVCSNVEFRG
jgi:hypothetical protein